MKITNRYLAALTAVCTMLCVTATNFATAQEVYGPGDPVLAIDLDGDSNFPPGEGPMNSTDQNSGTKYLNFGGRDTGIIVTPNSGSSTVQSIQFTSANDAEERDPTSFILYGTNDPIMSADNSLGEMEDWTEISTGAVILPADRFAQGCRRDRGCHSCEERSVPRTLGHGACRGQA